MERIKSGNLKIILGVVFYLFAVNSFAQINEISELTFTGNKKTKASFLNRIVKVKQGSSLDSLKIKTDIDRLKRLDGIAHATYTVSKQNDGSFLVNYELVENFSIIPGLRIGQANDDSFSIRASVFEFNGLGRNITFGGFYQREVFDSFGVFLEHPYLLTNKLGLGVNYQDLTTQQPIYFPGNQANYVFTRRGPEVKVFYEPNFHNRLEFSGKVFKEEYQLIEGDDENDDLVGNEPEPSANKALFRGQYEHVNIDLEYHQVKGYRNIFEAQFFSGATDQLTTEYILTNTTSYFKRIGEKGNWASRLQLTLSNDVDDTFFVPVVIDNQANIRGAGNTVARGTAAASFNTEYRHTWIEKDWFVLQSNTFLDVAGLRQPGQGIDTSFDSDNLKVYPGVGVRFIHKRIFNAVIRIDYGFRLSGVGEAQDGGLVFGIGQYF